MTLPRRITLLLGWLLCLLPLSAQPAATVRERLPFDSDWRFDTEHSRRIVRHLERGRLPVTFRELSSPWGHDSYLLEIDDYHASVRAFMDRAAEEIA